MPDIPYASRAPRRPARSLNWIPATTGRGLTATTLGLALTALAVGSFAVEALHGTMASAALPFAIGVGYLVIYFLTGKEAE